MTVLRRVLGLAAFWSIAALVALDDIDFFNPQDFFDLHHPHHEQIFALLVIFGFVLALTPSRYLRPTARALLFHGMWLLGGMLAYVVSALLFEGARVTNLSATVDVGLAVVAGILVVDIVGFVVSRRSIFGGARA